MTTSEKLQAELADARRQLASERRPETRKFWKSRIYDLTTQRLAHEGLTNLTFADRFAPQADEIVR